MHCSPPWGVLRGPVPPASSTGHNNLMRSKLQHPNFTSFGWCHLESHENIDAQLSQEEEATGMLWLQYGFLFHSCLRCTLGVRLHYNMGAYFSVNKYRITLHLFLTFPFFLIFRDICLCNWLTRDKLQAGQFTCQQPGIYQNIQWYCTLSGNRVTFIFFIFY